MHTRCKSGSVTFETNFVARVLFHSLASSSLQYEAALAVDSVRLMGKAMQLLQTQVPDIFENTIHYGKFWNNGSEGINCDSEPVAPWQYGGEIMRMLKNVSWCSEYPVKEFTIFLRFQNEDWFLICCPIWDDI